MRFALLLAAAATTALLAAPAGAQQTTKKRVIRSDHTVIVSRDESGRTRTKIVVQKRSFLDPGTQVFPGEQRYNYGPYLVANPTMSSPQENTAFDRRGGAIPGLFDLPFNNNPIGLPLNTQ